MEDGLILEKLAQRGIKKKARRRGRKIQTNSVILFEITVKTLKNLSEEYHDIGHLDKEG
jgi:hypothetical protein